LGCLYEFFVQKKIGIRSFHLLIIPFRPNISYYYYY